MTVKTPTTAETTAVTEPTRAAVCTGLLVKNPGSRRRCTSGKGQRRMIGNITVVLSGLSDDQHTTMEPEDVDMVPIELAQHVRAHDLFGGPTGRSSVGQVDDTVHDRKQCVHLVR